MKANIGNTLREIRKGKNLKVKEITSGRISASQISNIEKSIHIPSTDKFIYILSMLNTTYEEFLLYLDDEYFVQKRLIKDRFIEFANAGNIEELKKIAV